MKRIILCLLLLGASSQALAYHIAGFVFCDSNLNGVFDGDDVPLSGITVEATKDGLTASVMTGPDGTYSIDLEAQVGSAASPGDWVVSISDGLSAEATVLVPGDGTHEVTVEVDLPGAFVEDVDFAINDPACQPTTGACWMTAGGVKFEPLVSQDLAQNGPKDTFGGNVYPSCSSEPGEGGQWNHVAHSLKLHFMGTDISVIRCGNVDGIEPGSESPVTPFNFIEFEGIGWIQGIRGNKVSRTPVTFIARVEDRNEPGNEHSSAGEDIDRYFLEVTAPGPVPEVVIQVGTIDDPVTITGGNLQLHASSCDD